MCLWKRSSCALLRKKLVSLTVRFSSSCASSLLAFVADQQAVIAVERIQLAFLQAALQTVLQEMGAAGVEVHAAFLIHERLQQFQFGFAELVRPVRRAAAYAFPMVAVISRLTAAALRASACRS